MHKFLNALLVLVALVSGYVLYSHEHAIRKAEREIDRLKAGIADTREAIKLLDAEWASLTRPDRLEKLAEQHLHLSPERPEQWVEEQELDKHLPSTATAQAADEIGDIITGSVK